jgi:hypothetical protein
MTANHDVTDPAVQALIAAINADGGRSLIAAYRNDTWGEMRTRWAFTVTCGKVSRFETGQA